MNIFTGLKTVENLFTKINRQSGQFCIILADFHFRSPNFFSSLLGFKNTFFFMPVDKLNQSMILIRHQGIKFLFDKCF